MSAVPRYLVIRRRYLGDLVLLGAVFRNLRLHEPRAHITLLAEHAYAAVGNLHPEVNRTLAFPRRFTAWPAFLRELRRAGFTHVLDFDNTDKTAFVTRLSGAAVRVTYDRETNPFRQRWAYTGNARITDRFYTTQHITETYLELIRAVGVPVVTREIRLKPGPADFEAAYRIVGRPETQPSNRPRRLLVHPGTRSRFRLWPPAHFAQVCDRLQDEHGVQIYLVAGPGEAAVVREIRAAAQGHIITLEQRFGLGAFAALAAQFDLFLCHDSGPMHIAAGVGTPVVALFGSQNASIWRPVGEGHTVLQTALPCTCLPDPPTPCVREDSYRSYCVRKLTVDQVFAALRDRLLSASR
ncbi:MAG: glycosyltransferase family 9 protein [Opitutaceae bacterium]|nr:glycosyltransferase family 9 protein [Opitutaceae bacterium]